MNKLVNNAPDLGIDNPMWEELKEFVTVSNLPWSNGLQIGGLTDGIPRNHDEETMAEHVIGKLVEEVPELATAMVESDTMAPFRKYMQRPQEQRVQDILDAASWLEKRAQIVNRYCWTVTDPWVVKFVRQWAGGRLIDPLAGTGYWGYLMHQLGVDVALYDNNPPLPSGTTNQWHRWTGQFLPVTQMDATEAVLADSYERTLLLAWPPMDSSGFKALRAYGGGTLIHIGELGGCTGDARLVAELALNWREVADHRPVQFWGIHDAVTVWQRCGNDAQIVDTKDELENNLKE